MERTDEEELPEWKMTFEELTQHFLAAGGAEFRVGTDDRLYDQFLGWVKKEEIPVRTDIMDIDGERRILVTRRPFGSFEGLFG